MRKIGLGLLGLFTGLATAQVPAPDDPLWEYPAAVAFHGPSKPDCDLRVTVPGEKFCLQPGGTPSAWLRADEIARSGNVDVWRGPRGLLQQPDLFLRPSMALNRFNGFPAVKFEQFAEMETGAAADFGIRRFTLFIVGRKIPGTDFGAIFGHADPQYGALYWSGSNGLTLNVQSANPLTWHYEGVEDFHLIALRCDFETVTAYLNGQPLDVKPLTASKPGYPVNRGIAFTQVGRYGGPPPRDSAGRMNAQRGPTRGAEFAEIITYGHTLSDEQFVATTRYLIKKYGIAIPGRETQAAEAPRVPAEVFTFAAADDPAEQALANHPVMLGLTSPTARQCSFSAKLDEPGGCLRAADGMHAWLRGDDLPTRISVLNAWKSPPVVANEAAAGNDPGYVAYLQANAVGGLPAVRLADRSSLRFKTPVAAREFTAVIVGRQTPGTVSGDILSSDFAHGQGLAWRNGNTLQLRFGGETVVEFEDPAATEFHIAAITYRDGTAVAYLGGAPGQAREVSLPSGMRFDFVGAVTRFSTQPEANPLRGLGAFRSRPSANATTGTELAEIILWPRALDQADLAATLRYLRKKYSLR